MGQEVGNAKPFSNQNGTRRFELVIIDIFPSDDLKAPLFVPLEPFLVRLPHMGCYTPNTVFVHSFSSHALQEMCSNAM